MTENVEFKAELQKGNRIQIPRLIRWQFKLKPTQVLKVKVEPVDAFMVGEEFFAKMSQDGRITIPKLLVNLLKEDLEEKKSLVGYAFEVTLQPAETQESPE